MSIDDAWITPLTLLRPSSFGRGAARPRACLVVRFDGGHDLSEAVTRGLLRELLKPLLGTPTGTLTRGQATYNLRRLRHHGLIERVLGSHRYTVTDTGHSQALFLTRAHDRVLRDGLAQIASTPTEFTTKLRSADRAYRTAISDLVTTAGLAA